jgi:hypothetical protein
MQLFSAIALPHTTTTMSQWHRSLAHQLSTHDTMHLTFVRQQGIISLGNKEKHEFGDSKTVRLFTGMDATREGKEEWNALSLRGQAKQACSKTDGMALYRSCFKAGGSDRKRGISNPQQARSKIGVIPKNALAPPSGTNRFDGASKEHQAML